jgi:hypothetical protein
MANDDLLFADIESVLATGRVVDGSRATREALDTR